MAQRNKTLEITANTPPGGDQELPDWARPQRDESEPVAAPTEVPQTSATPALDNLLEWLINETMSEGEATAAGMEAIVRQVLASESPVQVLRQTLPVSGSDFVDIPMLLLDFSIRESEFEGSKSLPYYASMQVMMGNPPEPRVVNTGSLKILAQLKRLRELGEWPQVVELREARRAKKGENAPLTLVMVDQPA